MIHKTLTTSLKKKPMDQYEYSVVTAVYNVEKYLETYFKSIITQTLNFEDHIYLIMIDDGSTDDSAKIIKKWQKKYPNNIQYIHKENGGQSSARNMGLQYVKTPWVTFIDPDDFVHKKYFKEVDIKISNEHIENLAMIGCNLYFYFDKFGIYLDKHPLRYRFVEHNSLLSAQDLKDKMQLSASSAFFRTDLINTMQLKFDKKIIPNFEDAHFVNCYLIENSQYSVLFLKSAKYYYRRRADKNSSTNTAWKRKELFNDVLLFGCLDLFEKSNKKFGYVPVYLQRTILYHLAWYFRYFVDNNEQVSFLSSTEQLIFHDLLEKLFQFIEIETIDKFKLVNIGFFEKLAWVNLYKKTSLSYQVVYIQKDKQKLLLHYYSFDPETIKIKIGNQIIIPSVIVKEEHTFVFKKFITEYQFELPITEKEAILSIAIGSYPTYLQLGKQRYLNKVKVSKIKTDFLSKIKILFYGIARKFLLG